MQKIRKMCMILLVLFFCFGIQRVTSFTTYPGSLRLLKFNLNLNDPKWVNVQKLMHHASRKTAAARVQTRLKLQENDETNSNVDGDNSFQNMEESQPSSSISDPSIQAKLKAEISSPFRLLRQFLFAAAGIAGGLGTVTTIPQVIKSWPVEADRMTSLTNIAIDLTAMIAGIALFKWDSDQGQKKIDVFKKREVQKTSRLSADEMKEREDLLGRLPVEIIFSEYSDNVTRVTPLSDLWTKGQQSVVIVAGEYDFVDKTIFGARAIGENDFRSQQVYIVPFIVDKEDKDAVAPQLMKEDKKGFGAGVAQPKRSLMSAPYIAKPTQLNVWQRILDFEFNLAEAQGLVNIRQKGLVLAINRNGKVIRRGFGSPKWKELILEVTNSARAT